MLAVTAAIIQARMNSTRFPGKVLIDLAGKPMLLRIVERVRRAALVDNVIVATSTNPDDDVIWRFCEEHAINRFRGDEHDVLSRYDDCASAFALTTIVRITADCPLIDPDLIDCCIDTLQKTPFEYCSNIHPVRCYPDGLDVEVFTRALLRTTALQAITPHDREHVTPWMQEHSSPQLCVLNAPNYADRRWTVDTPADLPFIQYVYEHLSEPFSWQDVLTL